MPEDDEAKLPSNPAEFMAQLGAMTAKMWGIGDAAPDVMPSALGLPRIPQIGSLSASQFKAMATTVLAQRRSIEALQTQLKAFDEHLATLQTILEPLLEWSSSWAELEKQAGLHPGGSSAR